VLKFQSGRRAELHDDVIEELARYRHKIFIQKLGWTLPTLDGLECDNFDHADTVYVVAVHSNGQVIGCGRLLPTTQPYLLGELFPGLLDGTPIPCSPDIWELSRFAISIPDAEVISPRDAWANTCSLMARIVSVAESYGAKRLIACSVLGNERLLRRMGVSVHRAAAPQIIAGKPTIPLWLHINEQTRAALHIRPAARVDLTFDRSEHLVLPLNMKA
jgi:N-acyl-L-homoserine lactone synthetase